MVKSSVEHMIKFFNILGLGDQAALLDEQGFTFELKFYQLIASFNGEFIRDTLLSYSTINIVNGKVGGEDLDKARYEVMKFLSELPTLKVAVKVAASTPVKVSEPDVPLPKVINIDNPVSLSDASVIGQAVNGTSSQYRVAALAPEAALAVNFGLNKMSLRVEPRGTNTLPNGILMAIETLGLTEKSENGKVYWSLHMSITGIPRQRVLGAMLYDLSVFPQRVADMKELQYDL